METETPVAAETKKDWYSRATVRTAERHVLTAASSERAGPYYFSQSVSKVALHPHIAGNKSVLRGVLTLCLLNYLSSTIALEQQIVNPCFLDISDDRIPFTIPSDMRARAYMYYCDEAFHALCAADLINQVEVRTGLHPTRRLPGFMNNLRDAIAATSDDSSAVLVRLAFTVVSETLISQTLSQIPRDPTVDPVVRASLADHATDERQHHAYFATLLTIMWREFDQNAREAIGMLLPQFIRSFLEPDREIIIEALSKYFDQPDAHAIYESSFSSELVLADVRQAGRTTLRLLEKLGVPGEVIRTGLGLGAW